MAVTHFASYICCTSYMICLKGENLKFLFYIRCFVYSVRVLLLIILPLIYIYINITFFIIFHFFRCNFYPVRIPALIKTGTKEFFCSTFMCVLSHHLKVELVQISNETRDDNLKTSESNNSCAATGTN